jgi:hypothetical protein
MRIGLAADIPQTGDVVAAFANCAQGTGYTETITLDFGIARRPVAVYRPAIRRRGPEVWF